MPDFDIDPTTLLADLETVLTDHETADETAARHTLEAGLSPGALNALNAQKLQTVAEFGDPMGEVSAMPVGVPRGPSGAILGPVLGEPPTLFVSSPVSEGVSDTM